jgi:hypothetical protein
MYSLGFGNREIRVGFFALSIPILAINNVFVLDFLRHARWIGRIHELELRIWKRNDSSFSISKSKAINPYWNPISVDTSIPRARRSRTRNIVSYVLAPVHYSTGTVLPATRTTVKLYCKVPRERGKKLSEILSQKTKTQRRWFFDSPTRYPRPVQQSTLKITVGTSFS